MSDYDFNDDDELFDEADSERDERSELLKEKYKGTVDQDTVVATPLDTDLVGPVIEDQENTIEVLRGKTRKSVADAKPLRLVDDKTAKKQLKTALERFPFDMGHYVYPACRK